MQLCPLYGMKKFLLGLTQTQERVDNGECHAITQFSCFLHNSFSVTLWQQPGCLPKSWPLVTRSSSLCQQRKWSPLVRAGRISKGPAVLLVLNHQENYGLFCLLAGHMNHKELLPVVTKSTMFSEVSVPMDSFFRPYLMHSYYYLPSLICVLVDTSGRQKQYLGEQTTCQC